MEYSHQAVFFKTDDSDGTLEDWITENLRRAIRAQPLTTPPLLHTNSPDNEKVVEIQLSGVACKAHAVDLSIARTLQLTVSREDFLKRIKCEGQFSHLQDSGMGFADAFRHLCETIQPDAAFFIYDHINNPNEYFDKLEDQIYLLETEKLINGKFSLLYLNDTYAAFLGEYFVPGTRDELPCKTGRLLFAGIAPPLINRWI